MMRLYQSNHVKMQGISPQTIQHDEIPFNDVFTNQNGFYSQFFRVSFRDELV